MEHGILFKDRLVRAILEGHKTQTRRIWKPRGDFQTVDSILNTLGQSGAHMACPYGGPGDHLWVREAFAPRYGDPILMGHPSGHGFRADWDALKMSGIAPEPKWKPGIHLFRKDARIILVITQVRVQRLQEITEGDAIAEGVRAKTTTDAIVDNLTEYQGGNGLWYLTAREAFASLWDSINGERPGASWDSNPWVWCITFKRVQS